MRTSFAISFLLIALICNGAGLGPYNTAQHAVNGFMPTQLPGLRLWIDANRSGHANGTAIDLWQDFSGLSNILNQTTDSNNQPKKSHGINGRPGVTFDGTNDWMSSDITPTYPTNGIGFMMLMAVSSSTRTNYQSLTWQGFQYSLGDQVDPPEAGSFGWLLNENSQRTYATNAVNMFYQAATDGAGDSGSVKAFTNAAPVFFLWMNNPGGANAAKSYSKGALIDEFTLSFCYNNWLSIGGVNPRAWRFDGAMIELFITDKALNQAQLTQVERYMRTKYGVVEKQ